MRSLLVFLAFAAAVWAANVKLYLKDGTYQVAREYKVESDRVRFYSIERSDWEEIPLTMVDLKKTEAEAAAHEAEIAKDTKILTEEDNARREAEREVARIPQGEGVYWLEGDTAKVMTAAEASVKTNKGRAILKAIAPMPVVSGKGTLEIPGPHAKTVFTNPNQEFFIQLSQQERFGIAKLQTKGDIRIVENLTFLPVVKETQEDMTMVPTFEKQLTDDNLYKIWAREPLPPGEYAVVEYTEGKLNVQIWDFAIQGK
jgi:hypothetical protein